MKRLICMIIMCSFLTGCAAQTNRIQETLPEPSEIATSEIDETTLTEPETEAETFPELSAEIPEEAVIKRTDRTYGNDELKQTAIYYLDSHDNYLLLMEQDKTGEFKPTFVQSLTYDENDNLLRKLTVWENTVWETLYEYDSQNHMTLETFIQEDETMVKESTYDQYGNNVKTHVIDYDTSSGSDRIKLEYTNDYTDCDYDKDGNILEYREYRENTGELFSITKNTYDESGQKVFKEETFPDYDEENYDSYLRTYRYEYDENGNPTLTEHISYSEPDVISSQYTELWQYDERNRMICYEKQRDGNAVHTDYEYETLS